MSNVYDVIVLGVGAMGSSALYHLSRRGYRCLGLERFSIPHDRGSSHGATRIIRLAYHEDPCYVPLLRRSYELWRELERASGAHLLHITGSIDAGPSTSQVFEGAQKSCALYDLPCEILTSAELTRRFPGYRLLDDAMALFQPDGGFLTPEACISAYAALSQAHGAELHAEEEVLGWEPWESGVKVETRHGQYQARRLVVAAGAWISQFIPDLKKIAIPERQVLAWFQPSQPGWYSPDKFPVFNIAVDEGRYYGFPMFNGQGIKIGRYHHREEQIEPEELDRECHSEDERVLRQFVERYLQAGDGPTLAMQTCMFTNTPDEHFVIDPLPGCEQVLVVSPCSGHGFKFASVIGEILTDLVEKGETRHDLSRFSMSRFLNPSPE
jgi:sarcosine oxidase